MTRQISVPAPLQDLTPIAVGDTTAFIDKFNLFQTVILTFAHQASNMAEELNQFMLGVESDIAETQENFSSDIGIAMQDITQRLAELTAYLQGRQTELEQMLNDGRDQVQFVADDLRRELSEDQQNAFALIYQSQRAVDDSVSRFDQSMLDQILSLTSKGDALSESLVKTSFSEQRALTDKANELAGSIDQMKDGLSDMHQSKLDDLRLVADEVAENQSKSANHQQATALALEEVTEKASSIRDLFDEIIKAQQAALIVASEQLPDVLASSVEAELRRSKTRRIMNGNIL